MNTLRALSFLFVCLISIRATAQDNPYAAWPQNGSLFILTTPDGANLPADKSLDGFPLLVRLDKATFDFAKAQPHGEDIRFSTSDGVALPYQIEDWDAANGTATLWVRIPKIVGNARQELRVFWGKADAKSESSGTAVFNESNGYLSVFHMGGNSADEVGTLTAKDTGTALTPGMVGKARHLSGKQGVAGGEKIANYPAGSASFSTQAWFRAEKSNGTILGLGNEQAQGKAVMQFQSPPHIRMDCYFSGGNVGCESTLPMNEWIHVVHTYEKGDSRLYINGKLDGTSKSPTPPLNIRTPSRFYIGGWYNNYTFIGDLDEIRVSKVVRSADWVHLEFENQKQFQTLVGSIVQPGNAFSVSSEKVSVSEGKSTTVSAQAGGAQKVYWLLKRGGSETVVAVDQFAYTFNAGRVVGDQSASLQFKAVYPNEVKTRTVAIAIQEDIPEPTFTLQAPTNWNGRGTIEVVPAISNVAAMQAKGAGDLRYVWSVSGGAVIKDIAPAKLVLKRSQFSGTLTVKLALSNGGAETVASTTIAITEPASDPWVKRVPAKDEQPVDNQFYARDDPNEGTLFYNGTLDEPADAVFLKITADDKEYKSDEQKLGADKTYAFTVKLKPGLIKYKAEFGTKSGGVETVVRTVTNLVCGDAYIIDGQSNALATDTHEDAPRDTNDWIRSYGNPPREPKAAAAAANENLWCLPVWKIKKGEKAELGYWGMELAKRLVESEKVPVCFFNAAVGGTRIDVHQRYNAEPDDVTTIYGRMLWRVQHAKLTHGIRAILWHQGENDQGADGPTGGFGWETYHDYFIDMAAAWKQDFPNVQRYFLFQIWPNACSMGGNGSGDMLREKQRTLPSLFSKMSIMSTLGIKPPGGCHYPLTGWAEFARLIHPVIQRDLFGKSFDKPITPPALKRLHYTNETKDEIAIEFDQPVAWDAKLINQFYLDGAKDKVASGSVAGNTLTLKLAAASTAQKLTYVDGRFWRDTHVLYGTNGIAALTFYNVPIEAK